MKELVARAPGKIILSGEHSAVYGYPAIAVSVDRTLFLSIKHEKDANRDFYVDLLGRFGELGAAEVITEIEQHEGEGELIIGSDVPVGRGMGSSAAIGAALSTLVLELSGNEYDQEDVNRYALELEKVAHTNPSGIDNTVVVYGGVRNFQRNGSEEVVGVEIEGRHFMDRMFVVDTGEPLETTAEMVAKVAERFDNEPEKMKLIMSFIGETTEKIQNSILRGGSETDFMGLISRNQRLLEKIGVVSESCKEFVKDIENCGGAAKVSGAGGTISESGMVIVYLPEGVTIDSLLNAKGYQSFPLKVSGGTEVKVYDDVPA